MDEIYQSNTTWFDSIFLPPVGLCLHGGIEVFLNDTTVANPPPQRALPIMSLLFKAIKSSNACELLDSSHLGHISSRANTSTEWHPAYLFQFTQADAILWRSLASNFERESSCDIIVQFAISSKWLQCTMKLVASTIGDSLFNWPVVIYTNHDKLNQCCSGAV